MTIALAALAVGVTIIIAVSLRSVYTPADGSQTDDAVDAGAATAADPAPEAGAPEPQGTTAATLPDAPQPALPAPPKAVDPVAHERARKQIERGHAYLRKKRLASAIASYERALELDPNLREAFGPLGIAYERKGEDAQAQAAFAEYLAGVPAESHAERKRELVEQFSR